MQPTIELSNQIGAVLITLNAALVAWIVYSTWQEKRNAPADKLAAVLATRAMDLAFVCASPNAQLQAKLTSEICTTHGDFTNRNSEHGIDASLWFADELMVLTFGAAQIRPNLRSSFLREHLERLSTLDYTAWTPHYDPDAIYKLHNWFGVKEE